jgi:hypothetical protein
MARNPREFEDLLKLPPEERLRLANWLIDSATNSERAGSSSDSPRTVPDEDGSRAWAVLRSMTGTLEGPADWSQELDHYLYGTPKRGESIE